MSAFIYKESEPGAIYFMDGNGVVYVQDSDGNDWQPECLFDSMEHAKQAVSKEN